MRSIIWINIIGLDGSVKDADSQARVTIKHNKYVVFERSA